MTTKQRTFLATRFREALKQQPELKAFKKLLLRLGGVALVPRPDPEIPLLLDFGFVTAGPVLLKVMAQSGCHQNTAALWRARKLGIVGIGTGYALSPDGLWRQHTWGIRREGVIETTEERVKYFGLVLQGPAADLFAKRNGVEGDHKACASGHDPVR